MNIYKYLLVSLVTILSGLASVSFAQDTSVKIALLKYKGGGDWYANPTSLPSLMKFCNKNLGTNIFTDYATVEVGSEEVYD